MSRPLRIQFPGAIYHAMARGNAKQPIVADDRDRQELLQRLEETVERYGWEMFAFVLMLNHLHLLFRTPQANLSQGMQYFLSGYANWYRRRKEDVGHVFQGRFRGELIENESYFWNVSRYEVSVGEIVRRGSRHPARSAFVWLSKRHTQATRPMLADLLQLRHPAASATSPDWRAAGVSRIRCFGTSAVRYGRF